MFDIHACITTIKGCRGPFLEGLSIPDSAAFEKWASLRREQLAQLTLKGLRHRRSSPDPWVVIQAEMEDDTFWQK